MPKQIKARSLSSAFVFAAALLIVLVGTGGSACAEDSNPPTIKVTVGIYAVQVPLMSLKDNKFQLDFYIWFRWQEKNKAVKPYESFELANGKIDSRQLIENDVKARENYAILRCTATLVKF